MNWVQDLASLPAVVAILVVFTVCVSWLIRMVSKNVVDPFKTALTNHMEHDMQDRKEDREERAKMRETLDAQREGFACLAELVRDALREAKAGGGTQ